MPLRWWPVTYRIDFFGTYLERVRQLGLAERPVRDLQAIPLRYFYQDRGAAAKSRRLSSLGRRRCRRIPQGPLRKDLFPLLYLQHICHNQCSLVRIGYRG